MATRSRRNRLLDEEALHLILASSTDSDSDISELQSDVSYEASSEETIPISTCAESQTFSSGSSTVSSTQVPVDNPPTVYAELKNVVSSSPVEKISSDPEDISSSPPVRLEISTDPSFPPSSDGISTYSSTQSGHSSPSYPTDMSTTSSSTGQSGRNSPAFPSDSSTSSSPSPLFPQDCSPVSDDDSDDSLADFDIDPQSETISKKKAIFHVAEIPFNTLAQMVKTYLESIEKDPKKPIWPVPDMDRNQKRNFRKKTETFKMVNGSLRHLHIYIDEKNKVKRGEFQWQIQYVLF